MASRVLGTIVVILALVGSAQAANPQLVQALKQLGKAVDDVAVNISNAESDADAELLANVTKQAFANGLSGQQPDIVIQASLGNCSVTITTGQWRLWSQAQDGKIVDHGATIN